MPTTRKNIDFPDDVVVEMDRLREERHLTYNELVVSAVRSYLAPESTSSTPAGVTDRLDGVVAVLAQIQQRLERMHTVMERSQDVLELIEGKLTPAPEQTAVPTADEPTTFPHAGWYHDAPETPPGEDRWKVPDDPPPPPKRSFWRRQS